MQERKNFNFPPKVLYENRYCNQDDFSVLVCGGKDKNDKLVRSVFKIHGSKLESEYYTSMPNARSNCKTAVINSELFVFGWCFENYDHNATVTKFCYKTKTWSREKQLILDKKLFSVCSFKNNLYLDCEIGNFFVYNF